METDTQTGGGRPTPRRARACLSLAIAVACAVVVTGWALRQPDWPRETAFMAGIFVLAALLWATEALPLFATALLVVGLQILLLANPGGWAGLGFEGGAGPGHGAVLHAAVDPVLVLFFGGFLLAQAAVKEGVDKAMSALLLRPFGGRPRLLLLGLMLVTALFSMWMSNTATTAMMITLVGPMLAQMPPGEPFRKAVVLAVPFAANIGGLGTPIASPPNAVAVGFLQKAGQPVAFLDWMLVAVPLMLLMLAVAWELLWRLHRPATAGLTVRPEPVAMTRRGWFVVAVFTVTVLLWLTDRLHGLPASIVALFPAVVFTASGLLNRADLNGIEWNVLILIGGGISLGAGMQLTGLDEKLVAWLPIPDGTGVSWLALVLVLATVGLSTFMSNTAAVNLILPIGISSALVLGDGTAVVRVCLSIALAASMAMALPVSTPPNAIAYARGELSTRDMARAGIILGAVAVVLILAGGGLIAAWRG